MAPRLKFRNSSGQHILINAGVNALTFWIFGAPMAERVEISTVELEYFRPGKMPGRSASLRGRRRKDEAPGYVVESGKPFTAGIGLSAKKISVNHIPLPHRNPARGAWTRAPCPMNLPRCLNIY